MPVECLCCGFSSLQYPYFLIGEIIKCPMCGAASEFLEEIEEEDGLGQEDNLE